MTALSATVTSNTSTALLVETIRKAGVPDFWSVLEGLANSLEPLFAEGALASFADMQDAMDPDAILAALQQGDVDGAVTSIMGEPDDFGVWAELEAAVQRALVKATGAISHQVSLDVAPGVPLPTVVQVATDVKNPFALRAMREYSLDLIREVDGPTREGIRLVLQQGLRDGVNPRVLIPDLAGQVVDGQRVGGIIGLTERQSQAVLNYRAALQQLRPEALLRELRDKRFDKTVRAAITNDQSLDPKYIEHLVTRYEANYKAYRAETIARTESMRALAQGQKLMWDETLRQRPDLQLSKRWVTAKDERVREAHAKMHDVTIPYHDLFTKDKFGEDGPSDSGPVWGPPAVPNCRCALFIKPIITKVVTT